MEFSIYLVPFLQGFCFSTIVYCIRDIVDERKFYTVLVLLLLGSTIIDLCIDGLNTFPIFIDELFSWNSLFIIIGFIPGNFIGRRLARYYKTGEFFETK